MLAYQSAEVIKVENPRASGYHTRLAANRRGGFSASFLNNKRGKRSVALYLKHPAAPRRAFRASLAFGAREPTRALDTSGRRTIT